ncbi:hypothetical protein Tco_0331614 [Tanacetum coccineum]
MANLKFADTHNMVAFLSKPEESDGFEQIMDILNAHPIKYALTVNPTIYISCIEQFWSTVKAKNINGEVQLHALVDGKKIIITESTVIRDLQLEDAEGVDCLPNSTIFEQLTLMGSKTTAWNEFSSTMASAIICLATNQKFNFSKYIFESMIRNLDNLSGKFLMYPRFVQVFLDQQLDGLPNHKRIYIAPSHTKKIFGNMRRVGKGFSGRVTPLFPTMVVQNQSELGEDEVVHKELGDSLVRCLPLCFMLRKQIESNHVGTTARTGLRVYLENSKASLAAKGNILRSDEDRLKLNDLMELCTTLQTRVLDLEKTKTTQQNEIASLKRRVNKFKKKDRPRTHKLKRLYKVGLTTRVESSGDEEDLGKDASKQGRRINVINADEDIILVSVQDDADKEIFDVDALNGEEVFVAGQNENVVEEVVNAAQVSTAATIPGKSTTTTTISSQQSQDKGKGIMIEEPMKPMKKKDQISFDEETTLKLQAKFDKEERLTRENAKKQKEANIALIKEWDDIQAKIDVDHQLAERLQAQEQEELSDAEKTTLFQQFLEKGRKRRREKKQTTNKSSTKTNNVYLPKKHGRIQAQRFEVKRNRAGGRKKKRAREELMKENAKKQKVEDDKETIELKQCLEIIPDKEEVTIDAIPLAVKSPSIVGWKIHKEGRKSYYQIMRADGKSKMYMIFIHMLKSFSREDLEDLYKLVKAKYKSTRPVEDLDLLLLGDLKIMFEPHVKDTVWRNQQDYKVLD